MRCWLALLLAPSLSLMLSYQAAIAQDAQDTQPGRTVSAEEAIENAQAVYGPSEPADFVECDPNETEDENVIVVCRRLEEQSKFRVQSSLDRGENLDDGLPRAEDIPGIAGPGIFTGPPTVGGLCTPGSCPPPMPVMIDLEAIPEAPAGSDADKVARGEKRVD